MEQRLMVKQRMGEIPATAKHPRLEVFTSGIPSSYIFAPMQTIGNVHYSGTIHIPVWGKDLKRNWRRQLV